MKHGHCCSLWRCIMRWKSKFICVNLWSHFIPFVFPEKAPSDVAFFKNKIMQHSSQKKQVYINTKFGMLLTFDTKRISNRLLKEIHCYRPYYIGEVKQLGTGTLGWRLFSWFNFERGSRFDFFTNFHPLRENEEITREKRLLL